MLCQKPLLSEGENRKRNCLQNTVHRRGGMAKLGVTWAVAQFRSCLCNALLPSRNGCCWGSVLEEPPSFLPDWHGPLLAHSSSSSTAWCRPGPSTAPDALMLQLLRMPSYCSTCAFSTTSMLASLVSQMKFVSFSSCRLCLSVLYVHTLVSQGHKYYQHSLTLNFLKTPEEDKPNNFASSLLLL